MNNSIPERVALARKAATPLIAIGTPDQPATVRAIAEHASNNGSTPPVLIYSIATGVAGVNEPGEKVATTMGGSKMIGMMAAPKMLDAFINGTPAKTVLCVIQAQEIIRRDPTFVAALTMARDALMTLGKTVILFSPQVDVPDALQHDVMTFNDPLPDADAIKSVIMDSWASVKHADPNLAEPTDQEMQRATSAVRGLSAFEVGQASTMSLIDHRSLNAADLHERRDAMVDAMPGLSVDKCTVKFDDIRGIARARWFATQLFNGPEAPSVIVRIDELEKKMGGGDRDYEGGATKGDELQVLLTEMEDNGWSGIIAYGPPGSGKTLWTQAMGPTFGVQTINLDFGGTRSKYVGESEQNIRAALRTVKAIGDRHVYIVATCNELDTLKPELKRRFKHGVFFFDLPSADERDDLWTLYRAKFAAEHEQRTGEKAPHLTDGPNPPSEGWTGAEIRNACELAFALGVPVAEAATEIIPVIAADPDGIERRRKQATGRFKSASHPGAYQPQGATTAKPGRMVG